MWEGLGFPVFGLGLGFRVLVWGGLAGSGLWALGLWHRPLSVSPGLEMQECGVPSLLLWGVWDLIAENGTQNIYAVARLLLRSDRTTGSCYPNGTRN